jgi:endonuclease-3
MQKKGIKPAPAESLVSLRGRVAKIVKLLKKAYPDARVALGHGNPLQLLVATILSAQCTDERVNRVTPDLFRKYRSANDYATANPRVFEQEIRTTGFFRAKTKSIIECCKALVEKHGGEVPRTMEDLVELPGVGRKTANVVLGSAYGISVGIVVDTHVRRLAQRLGLSSQSDPEKIESDLMKIVVRSDWIAIGHLLIWHGRRTCPARKPKCSECSVNQLCPSAGAFLSALR